MSFDMVVDSPPGMTSPSTPSRSDGTRTSTASRPTSRSARRCSRKAPCRARTPALPATGLQQPVLAKLGDLLPRHGLAKPERHLRHDLRVGVVGGRLDDRG